MAAAEITQRYFTLSNARDLSAIFSLFAPDATYSSDNTGLHYGIDAIKGMTEKFFKQFPYLNWEVHSLIETTPNTVEIEFTLHATNTEGIRVQRPGIERIVVADGLIRHVEVRNR